LLLPPADFTYMQVRDAAFPGLIERGFKAAAAHIWPGIQKALEAEVVQGSTTAVMIGGHSLGAALATLIAYRAQVRRAGASTRTHA
jgi:acetyl esterase/lipase